MRPDPRTLVLDIDHSGLHSPPGTREWIITRRSLLMACLSDIKNNRSTGQEVFKEIKEFGGWQHLVDLKGNPFRSFEQFCKNPNGLGLEKLEIERRLSARELAEDAELKAAGPVVHAGPGRGKKTVGITDRLSKSSTNADRIVACLKRDRPDIAKRLAAGEFKSARAAAIAAGMKVGQSPLQALRSQWKKASDEERQIFKSEIA